jgi:hypothetical protein
MDSNTKIVILVLILVFIKFFAHTFDNFENTSPEYCYSTFVINPAKCQKRDDMGICLKYSCPTGQKLNNNICYEEKKLCKNY